MFLGYILAMNTKFNISLLKIKLIFLYVKYYTLNEKL